MVCYGRVSTRSGRRIGTLMHLYGCCRVHRCPSSTMPTIDGTFITRSFSSRSKRGLRTARCGRHVQTWQAFMASMGALASQASSSCGRATRRHGRVVCLTQSRHLSRWPRATGVCSTAVGRSPTGATGASASQRHHPHTGLLCATRPATHLRSEAASPPPLRHALWRTPYHHGCKALGGSGARRFGLHHTISSMLKPHAGLVLLCHAMG
mmetsp:Transcript_25739/g.65440  ORF Transcript_25739/g.65440 Transcript_25739/m.65440 type:complete len:209 (-) Transcript_25739:328-954(-)